MLAEYLCGMLSYTFSEDQMQRMMKQLLICVIIGLGIYGGLSSWPLAKQEPVAIVSNGECTVYSVYDKGTRVHFTTCESRQ